MIVLNKVTRDGLAQELTFEQGQMQQAGMVCCKEAPGCPQIEVGQASVQGTGFQAEGLAIAKALVSQHAWNV